MTKKPQKSIKKAKNGGDPPKMAILAKTSGKSKGPCLGVFQQTPGGARGIVKIDVFWPKNRSILDQIHDFWPHCRFLGEFAQKWSKMTRFRNILSSKVYFSWHNWTILLHYVIKICEILTPKIPIWGMVLFLKKFFFWQTPPVYKE